VTRGFSVLLGRRNECARIARLLAAVRGGDGMALVVCGGPGIGKTALLEHAIDAAPDFRVARVGGVESEIELPFAALQRLCAPMLGGLGRIADGRRAALATAMGLRAGDAPDRLVVAHATLSLLSAEALTRPLLCVIDDWQWLDRASAQTFALMARRAAAGTVALVLATRAPGEDLAGVPRLVVRGLNRADAHALLRSGLRAPLDARVCDRIVAEAGGNPLALLELPNSLTPSELAGGFGLPRALTGRIEESFRRRFELLGADTRQLLVLAAADPLGDPALLSRAAPRLGLSLDAAAPATTSGLVEIHARVQFRHPLVRSALYGSASRAERRRAHRALAEATDPRQDPDRHAWHRALAAEGPDVSVAAELERSAGRARTRGGYAAAAAFHERAAALTPEPAERARRALAAAEATHQAGAPNAALALLARAEAGPLDERGRARADALRAHVSFALNRGSDAPALLLKAAERFEPIDARLARETYLHAVCAALCAGRLATGAGLREVAEAASAASASPRPARAVDFLLDAVALLMKGRRADAAPAAQRALRAFRREELPAAEGAGWLWLAGRVAMDRWDYESWDVLSARGVRQARASGALTALPVALRTRVGVHLYRGELCTAASLLEELEAITEETGSHGLEYGAVVLAAWRGRKHETLRLIGPAMTAVMRRGEGIGLTGMHWVRAVLHNGLGEYEQALTAARQATACPQELGLWTWGLPELVEAAARSGRRGLAADALARLSEATRASGTDWAIGLEARSRALLTEGTAAERHYREAVERLGRTRVRIEHARARLLYGEWLRRAARRRDARGQLRAAQELFSAMGLEAFADRAARELLATGASPRRRAVEDAARLTSREAQIALLARDGFSNPEIGARLFISPRTVEHHLSSVFGKLGIGSRHELRTALTAQWR